MIGTYHDPDTKALFIELKNLVLQSSWKGVTLPSNTFKSVICSGATAEHQCGLTTEEKYYERLASDFGYSADEIKTSFTAIRDSMTVDESFMDSLVALKSKFGKELKIYAMANLSLEDFTAAKALDTDWSIFNKIFVSSDIGMRKPELRFFKSILSRLNMEPKQAIVIDDDTDNLLGAMSLGMRGILYPGVSVNQAVTNMLDRDPIARGEIFLQENAKQLDSITHTGIKIKENFAQLLILESTGQGYEHASSLLMRTPF